MKLTNLIVTIVLAIAIGLLYVLHFTGNKSATEEPNNTGTSKSTSQTDFSNDLPIAYVNIDTLLTKMEMYTDINEEFNSKQQKYEANFSSKYRSFESDVADFQEKVQKGLVTRREAAELETSLSNTRAELENQRNNYMLELQEENVVSQNRVIDYIMKYLEEYNSDNRFRFIFSYSFGGGLLYATNSLDITYEVLEGINKKYLAEKASKDN